VAPLAVKDIVSPKQITGVAGVITTVGLGTTVAVPVSV